MIGGFPDPAVSRPIRALVVLALSALALAACGGDEEPELTFEDLLVELEGRPLTPAEVAERAEVGDTLCLLDDQILDQIWRQLDDDQLDFQDVVIAELCPERAILYAGHTGRFVTEEAEESGVRTSTTRPEPTTTRDTTEPTTSRPTTATTGPPGTSSDSSSPSGSSSSDATSASTTATTTRPTTSSTRSTTATTATTTTTASSASSSTSG